MGRSIGTGVALELLKNKKDSKIPNPRCLALVSPFCSVKELVKEYAGSFGQLFVKEKYNNIEIIGDIHCPVFILHGKKDTLIPSEHSMELLSTNIVR